MTLSAFLETNRSEIINRCANRAGKRSVPPSTRSEIDHGVPLFLDQLSEELTHAYSRSIEISQSASQHGHDQLLQQLTISQVVHGYGDVCQSVTDLAVELDSPISTSDFRTLDRCLDDAIAAAVTEYAGIQIVTNHAQTSDLRILAERAVAAMEALQSGEVGITGNTGKLLYSSLVAIRERLANPQYRAPKD
jgi:hypothetical protein